MKGKIVFPVSCVVILISGFVLALDRPGAPEQMVPDETVVTEVEVEEGRVLVRNLNGPEQVVSAERVADASPHTPIRAVKQEPRESGAVEGATDEAGSSGNRGEIAGRVLDPEGRPIGGCEVIFTSWDMNDPPEFVARGWYRVDERYVVTDAKGEFRIRDVPFECYVVGFRTPGFVAKAREICIGGRRPQAWIDQTLEPAGVIFGRVVENLTGRPIKGAKVAAAIPPARMPLHEEFVKVWPGLHRCVATFTDADGRFRLDVLYPNEIYDVVAEGSRYHAVKKESVPVDSGEPLEFVLSSGGIIEGTVYSAVPGVGADGATVILMRGDDPLDKPWLYYRTVVTATDGEFRLDGLPADDYRIHAMKGELWGPEEVFLTRHPKDLALGFGKRITGVDLVLERSPKVSGRVVDKLTGEGIPGVVLMERLRTATTDEKGQFAFHVPPGNTGLTIREIPTPYALVAPGALRMSVRDSDVDGITIELLPGATVRGEVLFASGLPVPNPIVEVRFTGPGKIMLLPFSQFRGRAPRMESGEDGTYEISRIPPAWEFELICKYPCVYQEFGDMGGPMPSFPDSETLKTFDSKDFGRASSDTITLAPGEVRENVVLRIEPFGSISGRISDDAGRPVTSGYMVWCRAVQGPFESAKPDEAGFYSIDYVTPGEVEIHLSGEVRPTDEKKTLTVAPGEEVTGVDFVVPSELPKGFIAGTVVDEEGKPVIRAQVGASAYDEETGSYKETCAGYASTDESGDFQLENLEEGTYRLYAEVKSMNQPRAFLEGVKCPVEGMTLVIPRYGTIEGRVVRRDTGQPVPRFKIYRRLRESRWVDSVWYHPDGFFGFDDVPPGPWELGFSAEGIGSATRTLELGSGEEITDLVIEVGEE